MVTVVLTCSDHLIRRDPILDPCFQSRVMNGKPLGTSATQPSWNCEYKIMGGGSMSLLRSPHRPGSNPWSVLLVTSHEKQAFGTFGNIVAIVLWFQSRFMEGKL